jgi:hypothetical protein
LTEKAAERARPDAGKDALPAVNEGKASFPA